MGDLLYLIYHLMKGSAQIKEIGSVSTIIFFEMPGRWFEDKNYSEICRTRGSPGLPHSPANTRQESVSKKWFQSR